MISPSKGRAPSVPVALRCPAGLSDPPSWARRRPPPAKKEENPGFLPGEMGCTTGSSNKNVEMRFNNDLTDFTNVSPRKTGGWH